MSTGSARELALDIAERIDRLGPVTVRRFFGGAALVMDGIQVGFVMKGSLYLRVDDASRPVIEALGAAPFAYAAGSKTVTVASYYEVPDAILEDIERLRDWAVKAYRAGQDSKRRSAASTSLALNPSATTATAPPAPILACSAAGA